MREETDSESLITEERIHALRELCRVISSNSNVLSDLEGVQGRIDSNLKIVREFLVDMAKVERARNG